MVLKLAFAGTYDPALGGVGVQQPPSGFIAAYLNYIIFDTNFNAVQQGFVPLDDDANGSAMEISIPGQVVQQEGFVYVYLTNESNAEVYFDDLEITVTESLVVQNTNYYPFGLHHSSSWTRVNDLKNNFLYNVGSELNEQTKNYETPFRQYDPALGRFTGIDALASSFSNWTPYQFAYNDPIAFNDPTGLQNQSGLMGDMYGELGHSPYGVRQADYGQGIRSHGPYAGYGVGSGYHWSDGIGNSDWTLHGGSQMYRDGLAAGLTDIGGQLYRINGDGSRDLYGEKDGQIGFWVDQTFTTYDYGFINGEQTLIKTFGIESTFEGVQTNGGIDMTQNGWSVRAGFGIPDNEFGYDNGNLARELIGGGLINAGRPTIEKRFITKATEKSVAASAKSSRATQFWMKVVGKTRIPRIPTPTGYPFKNFRWTKTISLGKALGRYTPWVGTALLAWDAIDLTNKVINSFINDSPGAFWEKSRQYTTTVGMYNE